MKKSTVLFLVLSILLGWGCGENPDQTNAGTEADNSTNSATADRLSDNVALAALKINCYACHNPLAPSHDNILAPPLAASKWRYLRSFPEREEFIANMTAFVNNPTEEKALMRGAVNRFKVMLKQPADEATIKQIVTYIYDHKLEEPAWFAEHFEEEHGQKWQP